MLGLVKRANPLINFNPAPDGRLITEEGPRATQRFRWGGVEPTALYFKGKGGGPATGGQATPGAGQHH